MYLWLAVIFFTNEGVASSLICPTAREAGMGNTGFSLTYGPEAVYLNPAHLQLNKSQELLFSISYGRLFLDIQHSSLFLSKRFSSFNLGLGVSNFDYGDLIFKPEYPTEEDAVFNANDLSILGGAGFNLSNKGYGGIGIKFIKEYIQIYSAQVLAGNLALSYLPNQNLRFSLGTFDISRNMKLKNSEFEGEPYGLPVRFSFGCSNQWRRLLSGLDLHYLIRSKDWMLNFGEEIGLVSEFKLRWGCRYFDGLTLSGGLGISLAWLTLDYGVSYLPKGLGLNHYFTLKRNL